MPPLERCSRLVPPLLPSPVQPTARHLARHSATAAGPDCDVAHRRLPPTRPRCNAAPVCGSNPRHIPSPRLPRCSSCPHSAATASATDSVRPHPARADIVLPMLHCLGTGVLLGFLPFNVSTPGFGITPGT